MRAELSRAALAEVRAAARFYEDQREWAFSGDSSRWTAAPENTPDDGTWHTAAGVEIQAMSVAASVGTDPVTCAATLNVVRHNWAKTLTFAETRPTAFTGGCRVDWSAATADGTEVDGWFQMETCAGRAFITTCERPATEPATACDGVVACL